MDFSTVEITPIKGRGNNVDFSTIKITSKKVHKKRRSIYNQRNYIEKLLGNDVGFVKIWPSTYQREINVNSMWIQHGVAVGRPVSPL